MKKFFCLLLVSVLLVSYSVYAAEHSYQDLTGHWASPYILPLSESGVFQGYPDGTFRPDNQITVAEFIKIATVAVGEDIEPGTGAAWYIPYQEAAEANRMIQTGDFEAADYNRPITRGEMARIIVRALNESPESGATAFTDEAGLPYHLKGHIKRTYELGIMSGYPDGTFRADGNATRGEAARVITSMLNPNTRTLPVVIEGDNFRFENNILYYIKPDGTAVDTMTNSTLMTREEINWYFHTMYDFAQEKGMYFTVWFDSSSGGSSLRLIVGHSKENYAIGQDQIFLSVSFANNAPKDFGRSMKIDTNNINAHRRIKPDVELYLELAQKLIKQFIGSRYTEELYQDFAAYQMRKFNATTNDDDFGPLPAEFDTINSVRIAKTSAHGYHVAYSIYYKE